MSFNFSFSVNDQGEIVQTDVEKHTLKSAVEYGNLKGGTKIGVSGHQPRNNSDWGGSAAVTIEGIGTASMSSTFLKDVPAEVPTQAADPAA